MTGDLVAQWIKNKAYLFNVVFRKGKAKRITEVQVNSEFKSVRAAKVQVVINI